MSASTEKLATSSPDPEGSNPDSNESSLDSPSPLVARASGVRRIATQGSATARRLLAVKSVKVCLLTNARYPSISLQFCHVLARESDEEILTTLEWWWQLPYGTLNVDSRFNILILMVGWRLPMDEGDWTFIPHYKLIEAIYEWHKNVLAQDPAGCTEVRRSAISELYDGQTGFEYYVLPLTDDMKLAVIHQHGDDFDPVAGIMTVQYHLHPFEKFGPITSHVHPHFVVYSVGETLVRMTSGMTDGQRDIFLENLAKIPCFGHESEGYDLKAKNRASLETIMTIYKGWSSKRHVPQKGSGHAWRKGK
ncbi:hypothetical protein DFH06DRAFT_1469920 [Mycena polygramma]|nr:hypothetical protein DFH06DRAFT_1469920 [Mycena polygramma]